MSLHPYNEVAPYYPDKLKIDYKYFSIHEQFEYSKTLKPRFIGISETFDPF